MSGHVKVRDASLKSTATSASPFDMSAGSSSSITFRDAVAALRLPGDDTIAAKPIRVKTTAARYRTTAITLLEAAPRHSSGSESGRAAILARLG